MMNPLWSSLVNDLTPYVPGEQRAGAGIVKLNTNENPYPPSPAVLQAMHAVEADALRRYPDPQCMALREALAAHHGLHRDQVFIGNGSDEILALAFMAFFTGKRPLGYPRISYSFYPVYCRLFGIEAREMPLRADFSMDLAVFDDACGGVVFANPNAPTGIALERTAIDDLLERYSAGVVLVDEAYADFGAESAIASIGRFPNLLVSHSFSKGRSLAGMRIGAAFGDVGLIEALHRVKDSFNSYPVDVLAQQAALASVADDAGYRAALARVIATRDRTASALIDRGFQVLPSLANFLFVSPPDTRARDLFRYLDEAGILVRHWATAEIDRWLRISIGTDADMRALLLAIDRYLV